MAKKLLRLSLILMSINALTSYNQEYCKPKYCSVLGFEHVACGSLIFGPNCTADASFVDMEPLKPLIINFHNWKRNLVAGGQIKNLVSASRMNQVQWNEDLAYVASYDAAECMPNRNPCRRTSKFPNVVQTSVLYRYKGNTSATPTGEMIMQKILKKWWSEIKDFLPSYVFRFPSGQKASSIRHFSLIINERNSAIGCAAVQFSDLDIKKFFLSCNYAIRNVVGNHLYESGRPTSRCKTGVSWVYDNLCSITETMEDH